LGVFVNANGLRLHVVDYGGAGPPLLAVHGTGLVAQVWGVLVPYLAPHFHVYALDRRGHGESDKPERGYALEDSAGDYAAVVQAIGGEHWVALGHSSGGTSLGLTAVRMPELFRRVAMLDPIVFPPPHPLRSPDAAPTAGAALMVERTRRRRAEWPSAREMFESLSSKPPFNSWQPDALWDYVRHGALLREDGSVALKCPPALEAAMYRHPSTLDLFAEFAKIRLPVLIIRGAQSDRFPRVNAERAVAALQQGRLEELAGRTHFPSMEDPEGVARLVVPFLTAPT